jgi:histidinol-phosphate aminotransferase
MITCALAKPGAVMAAPEPSFVMYRMNAVYSGMRFVGVDLRADFSLDMSAWREVLARDKPALVFVAYPNNPTGNLFADDALEEIVGTTPGLVVVDEAYHAFAGRTFVDRLREFPNLMVLRTVSKTGMAGLRLGYAIGARAWTSELEKVRPPYNLNVLTQAVAPILLGDRVLLQEQADAIRKERARLADELGKLRDVAVYPSDANFMVVRVPDATSWFNALKASGILVKNLHGWHSRVDNCLRLTVGTPQENDLLLTALRKLT